MQQAIRVRKPLKVRVAPILAKAIKEKREEIGHPVKFRR